MATAEKRVVVTGGSGAVGAAIARELVRRGARVGVTFHRNEAAAHALCAELPGVRARRLDLTATREIDGALSGLVDEIGGCDAFVHAAGLASMADPPRYDALADLDDAGWDRLFAVNVKGAAFAARALVGRLGPAGGNLVFVGALSGAKVMPAPAAYAASKAALIGLAQSLAKELGPKGVRANVVGPGLLERGASATVPAELRAEYLKHTALKRFGAVEEIAAIVAFFALENTYVTGRTVAVDGGL